MVDIWKNRRATIPLAILVFWGLVLFSAWTLPLLSKPAQKKEKAKGTTEHKQEKSKEGFSGVSSRTNSMAIKAPF